MTLESVSVSWEGYDEHVTLKRISENFVVHYIEEMACCEYDVASTSIVAEDWKLENETASCESYRLNLEVSLPTGSLMAKGKYGGKFYFYE